MRENHELWDESVRELEQMPSRRRAREKDRLAGNLRVALDRLSDALDHAVREARIHDELHSLLCLQK